MKYKKRNNNAFTLIELLVAIGVFVVVISFAGQVFKVCIESHRTALANAEIMQKFRAITNQLDSDFSGLDKDGEIFAVWEAVPVQNNKYVDNDLDGYERFDRIMFFTEGDFETYRAGYTGVPLPMNQKEIRGNIARICYTLARNDMLKPVQQDKPERILVRNQHILTDDEEITIEFDPNSFTPEQWFSWNNYLQYDKISLEEWKLIPLETKADILSFILDINLKIVGDNGEIVYESEINKDLRGSTIDTSDPNTIHMLLCEGVGEFKIQGFNSATQTWIPEVDPDGDGDLSDTHFLFNDQDTLPGVLYSWPLRTVQINNINYPYEKINRENFNSIPGLGRALKFTFTLFDSKGIIEEGRTFSYIVYLDK